MTLTNDYGMLEFFGKIWQDTKGIVRLATKDRNLTFANSLFRWPSEEKKILDYIAGAVSQKREVFFSPDIYKMEALVDKKATKPYVLGSHVICLDFDGNAPATDEWYGENDLPLPSIRIQSSSAENQHVYWILDTFVTDIPLLENMRKSVTYKSMADSSGWDAGQLLRPPYTVNHGYIHPDRKHVYDVRIEELSNRIYGKSEFPVPKDYRPLVAKVIDENTLPSVYAVLAENDFVHGFIELFNKTLEDIPDRKRSDSLLAVGYFCTESGLSDKETYTLVQDADTRWGKYLHRTDRYKRLVDIVERAREKYPVGSSNLDVVDVTEISPQSCYNAEEFMNTDIHIQFFFDDILSTTGYMILAGPPEVGKTQLAIRLAESVAKGTDWLVWKNTKELKGTVLFVSLEMSLAPLKFFFEQMEIDMSAIKDNLYIMPKGDVMPLDTKEGRNELIRQIEDKKPNMVIIDSLSKAAHRSLSDDENVRYINSFFNQVQRDYGCAIVVVAHSKKLQERKKASGELDDLYGSRFIGSEADSVISFVAEPQSETIQVYASKMRLGRKTPSFFIKRNSNLSFVEAHLSDIEGVPGLLNAFDGDADRETFPE